MDYASHTTIHRSDLPVDENGRCCHFDNPHKLKLHKVRVDNGLISSSKFEKCDYITHWIDSKNKEHVIYIELKGCDIKKAFSQVETTILKTEGRFGNSEIRKCIIVCSRVRKPKIDSTVTKLKKKMKELTGTVPVVCSQQHRYIVSK